MNRKIRIHLSYTIQKLVKTLYLKYLLQFFHEFESKLYLNLKIVKNIKRVFIFLVQTVYN